MFVMIAVWQRKRLYRDAEFLLELLLRTGKLVPEPLVVLRRSPLILASSKVTM